MRLSCETFHLQERIFTSDKLLAKIQRQLAIAVMLGHSVKKYRTRLRLLDVFWLVMAVMRHVTVTKRAVLSYNNTYMYTYMCTCLSPCEWWIGTESNMNGLECHE